MYRPSEPERSWSSLGSTSYKLVRETKINAGPGTFNERVTKLYTRNKELAENREEFAIKTSLSLRELLSPSTQLLRAYTVWPGSNARLSFYSYIEFESKAPFSSSIGIFHFFLLHTFWYHTCRWKIICEFNLGTGTSIWIYVYVFSEIERFRRYSGTFIEYTMMTSSNTEELFFHKSLC